MSVTISLYYNSSDKRTIGKSLTNELEITGNIKTAYDSTEITIPFDKSNINTDITTFNYMKFNNKFWFLSKPTYVAQGIISFSMEVDKLETYKSYIQEQFAVLDRSETVYNRYLEDGEQRVNAYKRVQTKAFPNSFQPYSSPVLVVNRK